MKSLAMFMKKLGFLLGLYRPTYSDQPDLLDLQDLPDLLDLQDLQVRPVLRGQLDPLALMDLRARLAQQGLPATMVMMEGQDLLDLQDRLDLSDQKDRTALKDHRERPPSSSTHTTILAVKPLQDLP